ncbi:MAG: ATP-binding cassette domain-containing protein, partial [Dialister sp.]|nr:ATP-binding cassette domain-containing protein [Dialister sp.]
MSETEVLSFSHISIAYGGEVAARDISFTLSRGECLAIVGESGSGKTTLCKAILGLLSPDGRITAGDIDFKGQSLLKMSAKERRSLLGKEITTIFQDTKDAFCPIRTVESQIHEAMEAHGRTSASSLREKAFSLMQKLGLEEAGRIWDSYPSELSGGMMQRVGIVSAL